MIDDKLRALWRAAGGQSNGHVAVIQERKLFEFLRAQLKLVTPNPREDCSAYGRGWNDCCEAQELLIETNLDD